ncbi:MAG: hypothetical protein P1U58_15580 [Verrucomicrobiales bacterium]|nr:hypothetical protein [Verrucomicrobiales bacterium]
MTIPAGGSGPILLVRVISQEFGFRHIDLIDDANDGGEYDGRGISSGIRINW